MTSLVVRPFTELSGIASTVASFGMCRWSSQTFRYARCSAAPPRERAAIQPLTCRVRMAIWRWSSGGEADKNGVRGGISPTALYQYQAAPLDAGR